MFSQWRLGMNCGTRSKMATERKLSQFSFFFELSNLVSHPLIVLITKVPFTRNLRYVQVCKQQQKFPKLEKSQFLLTLTKSSVRGGRRASSKNCDFSQNCEKLEKSQFLLKWTKSSVRGGWRMPAKTAISPISAISPKIAKNWRNRSFC